MDCKYEMCMMNESYAIAYAEVLEILKHIPEEDYKKVPTDKLELFENLKDKNYIFSYDPSKTLNEQKVSRVAKELIILLFRDYWATPEQRDLIIRKQERDRVKMKIMFYEKEMMQEKHDNSKRYIGD